MHEGAEAVYQRTSCTKVRIGRLWRELGTALPPALLASGPTVRATFRRLQSRARRRYDMDTDDIKRRLIELQIEHRDLDEAIERMAQQPGADEVKLRRLKKRKLQIKDSIVQLQMQLVPDIPA